MRRDVLYRRLKSKTKSLYGLKTDARSVCAVCITARSLRFNTEMERQGSMGSIAILIQRYKVMFNEVKAHEANLEQGKRRVVEI